MQHQYVFVFLLNNHASVVNVFINIIKACCFFYAACTKCSVKPTANFLIKLHTGCQTI